MHDNYIGSTLAMQNKAGSTFKINQCNYINRLKQKTHMIISIDAKYNTHNKKIISANQEKNNKKPTSNVYLMVRN